MSENPQATTPEKPASLIQNELSRLRAAHGDAVLEVEEQPSKGMAWISVRPRNIQVVLKFLRDEPALDYKMLTDLTCVDRPDRPKRFCVTYNLYSVTRNKRLFLRVHAALGEGVPTASEVYPSANWPEREVYDLFGVVFEHHPNLCRILLPDEWEGHPLRKDYPIVGKRPVILFNNVKDIL